ncbi:hypothetical protein MKX01_021445 [Papaver californicum]|nr:hypothetical protein MKX01_021445 [Papaver californicum]
MEIDHYTVLELPSGEKGAKLSDADIKKAYKTRALELHPDKRPDDPDANINFQKLQTSFDILKDKTKRKRFDDLLRLRVQPQRQKRQRQSSQPDSGKRKTTADHFERKRTSFAPPDPDRVARETLARLNRLARRKTRDLKRNLAKTLRK